MKNQILAVVFAAISLTTLAADNTDAKVRTRLKPSEMSPLVFKTKYNKDAVLRAELRLKDLKGKIVDSEDFVYGKDYWGVSVNTKNEDWTYSVDFSSAVCKRGKTKNYKDIIKTLEDGRSHRCLVKVRPVDKDDKLGLGASREFVQILDVEFLPDGVRP